MISYSGWVNPSPPRKIYFSHFVSELAMPKREIGVQGKETILLLMFYGKYLKNIFFLSFFLSFFLEFASRTHLVERLDRMQANIVFIIQFLS